ncbi:hypothetical protein [Pseudoalteromonas byunsanensis]|nr:hypothetical protein [Pseudoalteromonas byunsanensis]
MQKFNDKARSADIPFAQGELSCKGLTTTNAVRAFPLRKVK